LRAFLESNPVAFSEGRWPNPEEPTQIAKSTDSLKIRHHLFESICKAVDMEEFKNFCFLIGVDFGELSGDRKSAYVRELILLFERRNKIDSLLDAVTEIIFTETENIKTFNSGASYNQKNTNIDKWVSTAYVEKAGIAKELQEQGYDVRWTTAKKEAVRVDLEGWEQVLIRQSDGTNARLKIQDSPAIGGYLILLKRKNR
ncbi:MAG: hypothetical protein MIO92_00565, partial [Methanosarcinaceae archaeon]|nr:hypothetical protein [Methanosarcinaceae archaeon]